jgi:hypothetical protein
MPTPCFDYAIRCSSRRQPYSQARMRSESICTGENQKRRRMTSDAGGLLLGAADRHLDLVRRLAGCFRDARDPRLVEALGRHAHRAARVRHHARLRRPERSRRAQATTVPGQDQHLTWNSLGLERNPFRLCRGGEVRRAHSRRSRSNFRIRPA